MSPTLKHMLALRVLLVAPAANTPYGDHMQGTTSSSSNVIKSTTETTDAYYTVSTIRRGTAMFPKYQGSEFESSSLNGLRPPTVVLPRRASSPPCTVNREERGNIYYHPFRTFRLGERLCMFRGTTVLPLPSMAHTQQFRQKGCRHWMS